MGVGQILLGGGGGEGNIMIASKKSAMCSFSVENNSTHVCC